ncbi:hypothetical protein SDJN03_00968, partial [Cucurbita argyrosperma subsp. sororia]
MGSATSSPFISSLLIALVFLDLASKFTAQSFVYPPARPIAPMLKPIAPYLRSLFASPSNNKQYSVRSGRSLSVPPQSPGPDHQWPNESVSKSPPPPF